MVETLLAWFKKVHCYGLNHTASHRVRRRREETQRKSLRPKVSKRQKVRDQLKLVLAS
jgi:hypothetical protein